MRKRIPGILVIVASILLPTITTAQELTHLNVPRNQVVNLVGVGTDAVFCDLAHQRALFRVRATGQLETEPFVVPSGKSLIITDVSWMGARAPSDKFLAGEVVHINIAAFASDDSFFNVLFSPGVSISTDTTDLITGSAHFTAGAVVAQNRKLCVSMVGMRQPPDSLPNSFVLYDHSPELVHVSGYLVGP